MSEYTPQQLRIQEALQQSYKNLAKKKDRAAYKFTPKRADKNQPAIVKDLRKLGIAVTSIHAVGEGVFDLLCAFHWLVFSIEVKDGAKPPSAREFTPAQTRWNGWWPGLKAVACDTDDVARIVQAVKDFFHSLPAAHQNFRIVGSTEAQYQCK